MLRYCQNERFAKVVNWLVVSNVFYFPCHVWDVIPTPLTNSYFSRWWNCTTNQCVFVGFQNPWLISIFQEMVSPRICSSGSPRSFWDAVGYHSSDPSAESLILPLPSYGVEFIVFLIEITMSIYICISLHLKWETRVILLSVFCWGWLRYQTDNGSWKTMVPVLYSHDIPMIFLRLLAKSPCN